MIKHNFNYLLLLFIFIIYSISFCNDESSNVKLKDFKDKHNVYIGAGDIDWYTMQDEEEYKKLVLEQFSMLTINYFYFRTIHPTKDEYSFDIPDQFIDLAIENNMKVRGHTLVWHYANPDWIYEEECTRENFTNILENHIKTIVSRYKGKIYAWDVVNEAVDWDG